MRDSLSSRHENWGSDSENRNLRVATRRRWLMLLFASSSGSILLVSCTSLFRVSDFGFRISGFGFRVSGFGFRVSDFGLWA